jgi:hypothetical protein
MSALAKRAVQQPVSEKPESKFEVTSERKFEPSPDDVLIHIRFHPNADLAWIGVEPPAHVSPQEL